MVCGFSFEILFLFIKPIVLYEAPIATWTGTLTPDGEVTCMRHSPTSVPRGSMEKEAGRAKEDILMPGPASSTCELSLTRHLNGEPGRRGFTTVQDLEREIFTNTKQYRCNLNGRLLV